MRHGGVAFIGQIPGHRRIPFDCPERFDCVLCRKEGDTGYSVSRFVGIMKEESGRNAEQPDPAVPVLVV